MIEVVEAGLILLGALFMGLAALGVVRLPDLLTRMHATTKSATLGVALIMLAVALHFAEVAVVARAFGVILFIMMTAPVAAHVIGRAGYFVGARLWSGTLKDELRPHYDPLTHELKSGLEGEPREPHEKGGAGGGGESGRHAIESGLGKDEGASDEKGGAGDGGESGR